MQLIKEITAKEGVMKKKGFLIALIVGLALAFTIPSSVLAADKPIKWKVQGFVPAGMLYHDNIVMLAEEIKKNTNGRLIFEVYPAGALVPPFEGVKAVSDGVYQANYGYTGQWVGKIPVAPLFAAAPGGFNTLGMMMWQNHGGGI